MDAMDSANAREDSRAAAFRDFQLSEEDKLKQSGANFLVWKFRVKLLLECAELWDVVDPDGEGGDGVSPEEARKWEARALIQSAVAFDMYDPHDPRECWLYLQNRFAPNTPARRWEFKSRLYSLRMKEGEKVNSFFSRVTNVLNHLHDMGVLTDEQELVSGLVLALPKSWDTFASIVWQETDKLTKNELFQRMRFVESRNEMRAANWGR